MFGGKFGSMTKSMFTQGCRLCEFELFFIINLCACWIYN